ncbi:hypothetical protein COLO4_02839 [Corchorus olitorius]|uniref:Uncharacterized protein n=1 Tax=Corchorus olitorius TaxID=93759 RepID=A0A1R3L043_9ROSI|nr:hypothetical protein COLO4_02839 [Corchorus olitorius]
MNVNKNSHRAPQIPVNRTSSTTIRKLSRGSDEHQTLHISSSLN